MATFNWSAPTQPNNFDSTTQLSLGLKFTSSAAVNCTGVQIWVPSTLPSGPSPAFVSIWPGAGGAPLAVGQFEWSALAGDVGTFVDIPFTDPAVLLSIGVEYMVVVQTFERWGGTPSFSFPTTVGPLTAVADNGWVLVGFGFPNTQSGSDFNFALSPIIEDNAVDIAAATTATATITAGMALEEQMAAIRAAVATITAELSVTSSGVDMLLLPEAVMLLDCLCTALNNQPNPPETCCLRPGDTVIQDVGIPGFSDDDCCRGQAYVKISGFYMTGEASSPFPSPSTDAPISPCGIPAFGVQLEMGVFRCIRTDRQPTCTEYTEAVIRQMADAKAMRCALTCFVEQHDPQTVAVGNWSPAGPDGGCLGSTWQVSVEVLNSCEDC
jgi:hypothetical protein